MRLKHHTDTRDVPERLDGVPERQRVLSLRRRRSRANSLQKPEPQRESTRVFTSSSWALLAAALMIPALLLLGTDVLAQNGATPQNTARPSTIARDLLIVGALVLINGLFAMAEAALLTVRRTRIDQLVEEGNRRAKIVAQMLNDPTRMLSTLQVGVTLISLFSAGAAAESAVEPFGNLLREMLPFLGNSAAPIAFFTVIFSLTLVTLVIGEITPKSIAVRHPETIALLCAYPIRWLQTLITPLVGFVTYISNLFVRPFGGTASFSPTALSEDELKIMVEQSEEHGVIEPEEKEMIHKVFDFADTVVRRVMTPRLDITAVEADVSFGELIRVASESGHSRLPVYDDNLDNIIGVVHVKDVLKAMYSQADTTHIRDILRQPYFIPENKRVDDLLQEFRRNKLQFAVVRDEYGTVTGVVTIEDLLEEIVGEIQDEYDQEEPAVRQVDPNTCIVDARMNLADFNDRMGAELPVEEADTLGGFVFGLLGHQPAQGESARWDGLEFRVEATDGRRIQRVRVIQNPSHAPASAEDEERRDSGSV
jgi:putative hemolysin